VNPREVNVEIEKQVVLAVQDGIRDGIKQKLSGNYNNPLDKMIGEAIAAHGDRFRALLTDAITSAVGDQTFREQVATQVRHSLAKTLVARFGGELEKQVNVLKSDPLTRARITLAIEEIVKERSAATT
jgi:hypothetical protein